MDLTDLIRYVGTAPPEVIAVPWVLAGFGLLGIIGKARRQDNRRRLEAADLARLTVPLPPEAPLDSFAAGWAQIEAHPQAWTWGWDPRAEPSVRVGRHRPGWAIGTAEQRLIGETREADFTELHALLDHEDALIDAAAAVRR